MTKDSAFPIAGRALMVLLHGDFYCVHMKLSALVECVEASRTAES